MEKGEVSAGLLLQNLEGGLGFAGCEEGSSEDV